MRLVDTDAVMQYLRDFRCADCDKRKGLKNGKVRFCYEIGDAPCRACDIGDTIEYFLDEDIAPTIDAIPVEWLKAQIAPYSGDISDLGKGVHNATIKNIIYKWQKEQEAR